MLPPVSCSAKAEGSWHFSTRPNAGVWGLGTGASNSWNHQRGTMGCLLAPWKLTNHLHIKPFFFFSCQNSGTQILGGTDCSFNYNSVRFININDSLLGVCRVAWPEGGLSTLPMGRQRDGGCEDAWKLGPIQPLTGSTLALSQSPTFWRAHFLMCKPMRLEQMVCEVLSKSDFPRL